MRVGWRETRTNVAAVLWWGKEARTTHIFVLELAAALEGLRNWGNGPEA
jgi:hypothetical protein